MLECPAMARVMVMARADKNASLMNLPFFEDVVDIASFCTFQMNWTLVGIVRIARHIFVTYLLANYLCF
jgi:hypothetical protein